MNPSLLLIPDRYKAAKLYSQIPDSGAGDLTFARNSNATRVNSAGLIEKVRENLILQSEAFDTTWALNALPTITANTTVAPDGTTTGDTIAASGANSGVYQVPTVASGVEHSFSVYIKNISGATNVLLGCDLNPINGTINFNASTGAIISTGAGITGSSVTNAGNGWYRVAGTYVSTGTSNTFVVFGTGVMSFAAWGAQLETGVTTPYIPTTTAAVSVGITADIPRLDYTGGGCGKLLLEPQRTNLITFSEQFDNAAWTKFGSSASANQAVSPDGFTNGDKLLPDNGIDIAVPAAGIFTAGASAYLRSGALTLTAASYTFSIFVKKAELDHVQLRSATNIDLTSDGSGNIVNLNNGTPAVANTVQDYGNGWYRVSHTFTATAATWYVGLWFWNTTSLTANGSQGFFSYGAQLEAGSYPTSYIPTLGSSVTCLADAASKTGISSLIGQSEGVLYAEAKTLSQGITEKIISISDGTAANVIYFSYSAGAGNQIFYVIVAGGVLQSALSVAVSQIVTNKIAIKYKANDCSFWLNGTKIHQVNSANMPTGLSVIQTTYPTVPYDFEGDINAIALYLNALTDAELATLTAL